MSHFCKDFACFGAENPQRCTRAVGKGSRPLRPLLVYSSARPRISPLGVQLRLDGFRVASGGSGRGIRNLRVSVDLFDYDAETQHSSISPTFKVFVGFGSVSCNMQLLLCSSLLRCRFDLSFTRASVSLFWGWWVVLNSQCCDRTCHDAVASRSGGSPPDGNSCYALHANPLQGNDHHITPLNRVSKRAAASALAARSPLLCAP